MEDIVDIEMQASPQSKPQEEAKKHGKKRSKKRKTQSMGKFDMEMTKLGHVAINIDSSSSSSDSEGDQFQHLGPMNGLLMPCDRTQSRKGNHALIDFKEHRPP